MDAVKFDSPECLDCPLHNDCDDKRMALCRVMSNAYQPAMLPIMADRSESEERRESLCKYLRRQEKING